MSFDKFRDYARVFARKTGDAMKCCYISDGMYIARFSSGAMVCGNSIAKSVELRWGSGHRAYAKVG